MKRTRFLLVTLLAAGLALVPGRAARGFSYFQYGGYVVVWNNDESLRYLSPSTFPPGSDTDTLYLNALGLWMLVPSADFTYYYYHLPQDYPIDHYDGYSDTIAVPAEELDPGVLAVTYMVNYGPQWYDMDMLFSDYPVNIGWTLEGNPDCTAVSTPGEYGYSFLLVATHELGHALGLGHDPFGNEPPGTPWFIGTMNPRYPAGGPIGAAAIIEVHADDRGGTRFLYPHTGPTDPMVDLANAGYAPGTTIGKAVPAPLTPTTVYPAGVVTFRSVIENFGNQNVVNVRQGFYLSTDELIDPSDVTLGDLRWDIAYGDGLDFSADADMPEDIAAGAYYVGSILDDLDEIPEEYEDNNVHVYCTALTIAQFVPAINPLSQGTAACGQPYTGPTPSVTHPLNMAPLTWSLVNPPAGMTINPASGVISWPNPIQSPFLYAINIRATNSAGQGTTTFFLGVGQAPPQIQPISDRSTPHTQPYTGPTPQLTDPPCMTPILNWALDSGPVGMTISYATGVVAWSRARYSPTPYTITVRATNSVGNGTVTWHLAVTGLVGDLDCDGDVDFNDISPFVLALQGEASYWQAYPNCEPRLADCNADGLVNFDDINAFVALLSQ